ncbi:MAG: hypothetical protein WDO12_13165 [Pseudomonadota bacterium]
MATTTTWRWRVVSSFAGNRGHFVVGGEWAKSDGVGNCLQRKHSYCQNSETMTYTNTGYASGNGLPNFVVGARQVRFPRQLQRRDRQHSG